MRLKYSDFLPCIDNGVLSIVNPYALIELAVNFINMKEMRQNHIYICICVISLLGILFIYSDDTLRFFLFWRNCFFLSCTHVAVG